MTSSATPSLTCPACRMPRERGITRCPHCGLQLSGAKAAELGVLDANLRQLSGEVTDIDRELTRLAEHRAELENERNSQWQRWNHLMQQRSALIQELRGVEGAAPSTATPAGTPPAAAPAPGAAATAAAGRPPMVPPPAMARRPAETSPAMVQNVLLIIGGILLSAAALAFTVFAWSEFGIGGRAIILGLLSLVSLAIPAVVWHRFRLPATAETLGAVALSLMLLDGYAAWRVDLFKANQLSPWVFAGVVAVLFAVVAFGYSLLVPLRLPRPLGIIAAQVALVFLAFGIANTGLTLAVATLGLAAMNMVTFRLKPPQSASTTIVVLFGTAAAALTSFIAAGFQLFQHDLATGRQLGGAVVWGGLAALLLAIGASATNASQPTARRFAALGAASLVITATFGAAVALADDSYPRWTVLATAVAIGAVALAAATAQNAWRQGAAIAAGVWSLPVASISAGYVLFVAATSFDRGLLDVWTRPASTTLLDEGRIDYLALAGIVLALAAIPLALRRPNRSGLKTAVATAIVIAVVCFPAAGLALWAAVTLQLAGATALLAIGALALDSRARYPVLSLVAVLVAGYSAGTALASEAVTLAYLPMLTVVFGVAALMMRRPEWQPAFLTDIALAWLVAGVVATVVHFGASERTVIWVLFAAAAVTCAGGLAANGFANPWQRHPAAAIALVAGILGAACCVTGATEGTSNFGIACAAGGVLLAGLTLAQLRRTTHQQDQLRALGIGAVVPLMLAVMTTVVAVGELPVGAIRALVDWLDDGFTDMPTGGAQEQLIGGVTADGELANAVALGLTALGVAAVLAIYRAWRPAIAIVGTGLGLAALAAVVAVDASWQVGLGLAVALALASALTTGFIRSRLRTAGLAGTVLFGGLALGWSFVSFGSAIIVVVAGFVVATAIAGWGNGTTHRAATWVAGLTAVLAAIVLASGLTADRYTTGYVVLGAAAALLVVAKLLPANRGESTRILEWLALLSGLGALALSIGAARHTATVLTVGGLIVAIRALIAPPAQLGWVAVGLEVASCWFWLHVAGFTAVEAHTAPVAVAALIAGLVKIYRQPSISSWLALGPGLLAAFVPTLALVVADGTSAGAARPLILLIVSVLVLIGGAMARRQAPVLLGAGTTLAITLRIAVPLVPELPDILPLWIPLAALGVALVVVGATWEARRRDMRRLISSIRSMR